MDAPDVLELVRRMRTGDQNARELLVVRIYERLVCLSRSMLRSGSVAVQRWEQTEDIAHGAWARIQRALESEDVTVNDEAHLFRLAARHVRFELIDLYRKHTGARGISNNHETAFVGSAVNTMSDGERFAANDTMNPNRISAWADFHQSVENLPDNDKAVVDLLWYQGLTQREAAELLGVDVKTVKRRWRKIKLKLADVLDPDLMQQ